MLLTEDQMAEILAELDSDPKDQYLFVRLGVRAKSLLVAAARRDGRAISDWVRRIAVMTALNTSYN